MERNITLIQQLLPGFLCRIYHDATVPLDMLNSYRQFPIVELVNMQESLLPKMTWRFLPADDSSVQLFISRDADSRISLREKILIDSWVVSNKTFFLIKDHPFYHRTPLMLGGLWGMRLNGKTFGMQQLIVQWQQEHMNKALDTYNLDQEFLDKMIYPVAEKDMLYFDDFNLNKLHFCKPVNLRRNKYEYIGEVFNEYNQRAPHYKDLRNYYVAKWPLIGKLMLSILFKFKL